MPRTRMVMAFVLAPAVFPLAAWIFSMVHYSDSPAAAFPAFLVGAGFTYPTSLALGLPLFLLFRRRHWHRWWQYSLGGAALGALLGLAVAWSIWPFGDPVELFLVALRFAAIGILSAFIFWL